MKKKVRIKSSSNNGQKNGKFILFLREFSKNGQTQMSFHLLVKILKGVADNLRCAQVYLKG